MITPYIPISEPASVSKRQDKLSSERSTSVKGGDVTPHRLYPAGMMRMM